MVFYSSLKNAAGDRETLSAHIKTLIIDESPARSREYVSDKVLLRTEGNYLARDPKEIRQERARRVMVRDNFVSWQRSLSLKQLA